MDVALDGCSSRADAARLVPNHLPFTIHRNGTVDMQRWRNELEAGVANGALPGCRRPDLEQAGTVPPGMLNTKFHGRQLHGKTVSLAPAIGYVVREVGEKDDGHARVKDFRVEHWFDEVTYWNHAVAIDERGDWFPKVHASMTKEEFAAAQAATAQRQMEAQAAEMMEAC